MVLSCLDLAPVPTTITSDLSGLSASPFEANQRWTTLKHSLVSHRQGIDIVQPKVKLCVDSVLGMHNVERLNDLGDGRDVQ